MAGDRSSGSALPETPDMSCPCSQERRNCIFKGVNNRVVTTSVPQVKTIAAAVPAGHEVQ